MKYSIIIVLLTIFCSSQTFSQEKNITIPSPDKNLIDILKDIHNYRTGDQDKFSKNEFLTDDSRNNKLIRKLENLENEFYDKIGLNDNNLRTSTTTTLLADGFLLVEYIYQKWIGGNWVNDSKYTNLYDVRNNMVQSTEQIWNVTVWYNYSRYSYTYDANNNQTESVSQNWDGTYWFNISRYLSTYNSYNKITQRLRQSWNSTAWVNMNRYLYTYDLNIDLTLEFYQTWSGTAWADKTKKTYTYDSNHNKIEQVYQSWSGTAWVNQSKYTYIYDANNNKIQQIYQNWDVSLWKNSSKVTYTYNSNNDPIELLSQTWDVSLWKNSSKLTYTYNSNNDPIELLTQTWDVSIWKNLSKLSLTYDSNNNGIGELHQTWDGTTWVNSEKYTYTYVPATIIKLTSPNGGENWPVGTTRNITWTSSNIANIKLQYSKDNGTHWIDITNVSASAGSYSWTVPNNISSNCKVLISDVSNASLFDESDSIFSIVPAPSITVNSPNGGENLRFGSSHDICWTSVNVANVKLEYTINNGTSWVPIIESTPSDGSYSWTVQNTPSTNCKVLISNASNTTINDQSDAVFTIFTYPSTITFNKTYSFGDPNNRRYQIIGIPGNDDLPISNYIPGSSGKENDWRAFRDPGSGNYIEYPIGTFNFGKGRAFWIVSKNQITINDNVNTVNLEPDNTYSINLHNEWNLISNPFDKTITWNSIQTKNSISQPIHFYQAGGYTEPANFEPYKGYYFYNDPSLGTSSIKVPYFTTYPLPKNNSEIISELDITLTDNSVQEAKISVGISGDAKSGVDLLDIFSPPSQFCEISMSLYNSDLETNYKYLQKEFRPEIGNGQEYDLVIKNVSDKALELVTSGLEYFNEFEIYLLDKNLMKLYDLREQDKIEVKKNTSGKEYSLFIGTEEYILQKKSELVPTEFSLYQNYPNPFNPVTTIRFSIPKDEIINLSVYNILGELVKKVITNQLYEAGYYEVELEGSSLSSGVYIYKIETGSFVETKKMVLLR